MPGRYRSAAQPSSIAVYGERRVIRWRIIGGPRQYGATAKAADIASGWAWDIEAGRSCRTVRVEIASAAGFGYMDAELALRDVLDEPDPPERLLLSTHGIERL